MKVKKYILFHFYKKNSHNFKFSFYNCLEVMFGLRTIIGY